MLESSAIAVMDRNFIIYFPSCIPSSSNCYLDRRIAQGVSGNFDKLKLIRNKMGFAVAKPDIDIYEVLAVMPVAVVVAVAFDNTAASVVVGVPMSMAAHLATIS